MKNNLSKRKKIKEIIEIIKIRNESQKYFEKMLINQYGEELYLMALAEIFINSMKSK